MTSPYLLPILTLTLPTLLFSPIALTNSRAGDTTDSKSSKNVVLQPAPREPRFYVSLDGGADVDFNATKFISNGGGNLLNEPARVDARYYGKTHDITVRTDLTAGYNINPALSVFLRFEYEHAYTSPENIGRVTDVNNTFGADFGRNYPIVADLKDYETFGGKAGIKVAVPTERIPLISRFLRPFKPYFSIAAGGKFVGNTTADVIVNPGGATPAGIGEVRLYSNSWVFSTDARLGLEYDITKLIALTVEGGIGYDTKLDRAGRRGNNGNGRGSNLEQLGLTGVNGGGERLYAPLTAGVKVSF